MIQAARGAEEGEGMADLRIEHHDRHHPGPHPAHVELHGEGVESDADGTVLDEPLGHVLLVPTDGDLDPPGHPDGHLGPVVLAGLLCPVVAVLLLQLQASDVSQGLVRVLQTHVTNVKETPHLHKSSATSAIYVVTVHQLLLGQAHQFS